MVFFVRRFFYRTRFFSSREVFFYRKRFFPSRVVFLYVFLSHVVFFLRFIFCFFFPVFFRTRGFICPILFFHAFFLPGFPFFFRFATWKY